MSEMMNDGLNAINEQAKKQATLRRKCAIWHTAIVVFKAAVAAVVCWGLCSIGFISNTFYTILLCGCFMAAAFLAGVVWGAA
ncbi:MAG: hypothetical protein IKD27_07960 [Oscillospiraceae bacterium]|nr:hypothetical protein [Oscillospiraceae bacterium]